MQSSASGSSASGGGAPLSAAASAFTPPTRQRPGQSNTNADESKAEGPGRNPKNESTTSSKRGSSKRGGRGNSRGRGGGGRGRGSDQGSATPRDAKENNTQGTSRGGRGGGGGGGDRSRGRGGKGGRGARGRRGGKGPAARAEDASEDEGPPLCIVCANEIEYFAVGECNHPGRCSTCAMRSRVLLKDRSCPECKTVADRLVVAELPSSGDAPGFETFNLWGDFAGPDSKFDDESGMVFHACEGHYDDLLRARDLYCPVVGCGSHAAGPSQNRAGAGRAREGVVRGIGGRELFPSKGALLGHMKDVHQRFLCVHCVEGRPLFLSEQEVFTATGLRKHEGRVEGGHPLCRFCSKRFFDNTALYDHMTGTHINCHLCPEENQHRYFRGEPQLRDHLRTAHFLCDRGGCRQRGVVSAFNTPQEFQAHLLEDHGIADRRVASAGGVGFNVRRAARDGTGLHGSYNSVADATSPVAPGESFAAPDPELDLAGGIVVPVPSTRGRGGGAPFPGSSFVGDPGNPSGGVGGQRHSRGRNGASGAAGGGGAAGEWAAATARSSSRPSGLQEAFPSLPAAPPRGSGGGGGGAQQERHEFSLVGKTIARPDQLRRGGRDGSQAAGSTNGSGRGGAGAGIVGSEQEETEKRQLMRNRRLADALGIRAALGAGAAIGGAKVGTSASGEAVAIGIGDGLDAIREHLTRTNYSTFLVAWARANRTQLMKLERRLAELVADRKGTSTQLKPMPSEDRKAAHELAVHYGLVTQSFDLEPKRYVSVIKQKGCRPPSRLLSTAASDPSYKGTDEAVAEGSVPVSALERTMTNPNPRATALLGHAAATTTASKIGTGNEGGGHSPPETTPLGGGPRTSTVTSISSADPLAVDPVAAAAAATAAAAEAESKKTFYQRSKRRGVLPPPGIAAPAPSTDSTAPGGGAHPTPSASPPPPSSAAGSSQTVPKEEGDAEGRRGSQEGRHAQPSESGFIAGKGSSPTDDAPKGAAAAAAAGATAAAGGEKGGASAAAGGPANPECLLVFHSVGAGLGGGDAVLASVRTLVPARTVVGVRPATAAEAAAAGVQGFRGGGGGAAACPPLVMEFTSELNARRAWEKIEKEAEQLVAAARVTRTDYHAPFRAKLYPSAPSAAAYGKGDTGRASDSGGGESLDVVRDNWDDSSDEEEEKETVGGGALEEESNTREEVVQGDEAAENEPSQEQHPRGDTDQDPAVENEDKEAAVREERDGEAAASSPGIPPFAAAAAAVSAGDATATAASAPAVAASSAGPGKKSKWGNSAIRGKLLRPSDGRATTVEQEAAARRERIEKLRRLEEARRESRQKRDQHKRAERSDAGKLDAHAFVWENFAGESSSESSTEENDDADEDQPSSGTAAEAAAGLAKAGPKATGGGSSASPPSHPPEEGQGGEGWACGTCTFWNATNVGEAGVTDDDPPRCGMCDAAGPRNARSPWLPA